MKSQARLALLAGVAAGLLALASAGAAPVTIRTGATVWKDTSGNQINAHGGCVLQVGPTFYWYGENRTRSGDSIGVNCYASTNLVDWTFRRQVLSRSTAGLGQSVLERPKLIYNAATRKFVLWVHRENLRNYVDAQALVAQCDRPDGDFALVKIFRPFEQSDVRDHGRPGFMSRDCTLFKDDDGTAWFISSANENADLMFYQLSPDYLDTVDHFNVLPGASREAPVLFKQNGKYCLITSACTGWNPNYNTLQEADHITGPYGPQQGLISRVGDSTFNSQCAFVFPVAGSKGSTLVFMTDRWKVWDLPNSRTTWLPMRFDNGRFQPMAWGDHWQLDLATGLATFPLDPVPGPDNIARLRPVTCDKHNQPSGKEPRCVVDGSTRTGWAAANGEAPQWLKVDLGQPCKVTESRLTWEGDQRAFQYFIESSLDGATWVKAVDNQRNTRLSATNNDALDSTGRYFRLTLTGKGAGTWFWAACVEWELLDGSTNLALNKPVEASSAEWGRYAAKLTDGDFGTYWGTGDALPGHWAQVDLGTNYDLSACRLLWQNPGYYYQYKIQVSRDGTSWDQVVDMTDNTVANRLPVHAFSARGRYVKLTLTGADDGCWPALAEFEVFADGKVPPAQPYTPFRSSFGPAPSAGARVGLARPVGGDPTRPQPARN
jgi:hypothetical protein